MKRIGRTNLVRLGLGLLVICLIVALVVVVILFSQRKGGYQVYTGNIGTDRSCANTTLVLSPNLTAGSSYQMNVANVTQGDTTATIAGNPDFALSWSKDTNGKPLAVINVGNTANNQWKCTAAARQTLQTDFLDFYKQLWEQLETHKKILIPGGAALIMQRIADALPATYSESLFYHYGFSSGFAGKPGPYIDLQPGMRLQIETEANQFVGPSSPLNGPITNAQNFYQIGSFIDNNGNRRLSFDAFLSSISAPAIGTKTNPTTISGLIDLQASGTTRRFFRLFYPAQFPASSSPSNPGLNNNVTLIGADTLADLDKATQSYLGSYQCATATVGNLPIECIIFRGRTTIVPEIGIFLNQQLVYVPVGTTVQNIGESMFSSNLLNWNNNPPFTFSRLWTDGNPSQSPAYTRVNFSPPGSASPSTSTYELPVLMGDSFVVSGSS